VQLCQSQVLLIPNCTRKHPAIYMMPLLTFQLYLQHQHLLVSIAHELMIVVSRSHSETTISPHLNVPQVTADITYQLSCFYCGPKF